MQETEHPTLELQKEHWKYWNSRYGGRAENILRPLRRGEKILGYLRSLPLERPTILDMGCGMGWFANLLAEFGPTTGIDLSRRRDRRGQVEVPPGDVHGRQCL